MVINFFSKTLRCGEDVEGIVLGLSLVRQLAEAYGWQVAVESVVSQGSTFTIRIPVGALANDEAAAVYY